MTKTVISGGTWVPSGSTSVLIKTKTGAVIHDISGIHLYTGRARKTGLDSTITYDLGRTGSFQPCYHVKKRWLANGSVGGGGLLGYNPSATGTTPYTIEYRNVHERVWAESYSRLTDKVGVASTSLASVQWAALAAQAIDTMAPSFGGDMSIINSVLELRDFKRVATSLWSKVGKTAAPNGGTWWDILVGAGKKDSTLQRLSKTILSYKFGYESLYRDIVSLVGVLSGFDQRYSELVRRANTPQQAYFGYTIPGSETSGSSTEYTITHAGYGFYSQPYGFAVITEQPSRGIRYSAAFRYRYPLPQELLAAGGRNKALLDRLGVQNNPAIIWNGIPWTFLIDWLVDVGSFLGRLRVDNIRFQFECLEFCHSARLEKTYSLSTSYNQYYASSPKHRKTGHKLTDKCTVTTYDRRVGLPPSLLALNVKAGLTPLQVVLGGSLVGARRRRSR